MKIKLGSRRHYYPAIASILLIVLIVITLVVGTVGCGDRISKDLEIRTWADLDRIRYNLDGHHILMNDLDATTEGYEDLASPTADAGFGWWPIGTSDRPFAGTFDGQGHEIRDLVIDRPEAEYEVGLFGVVRGDIENVGVVNATVVGYNRVGGLVGDKGHGTVSNCYFSGNVTGDWLVGGLLGWGANGLTMSNCYATGIVIGESDVGGLVGGNLAVIWRPE